MWKKVAAIAHLVGCSVVLFATGYLAGGSIWGAFSKIWNDD